MKIIRLLFFFSLAIAVAIACKKDEPEEIRPDSTPTQQLSKDGGTVDENLDEVLVDILQVLVGTMNKMDIPCGATLDSVISFNKIVYFLTYDGMNCSETSFRSGRIEIEIKQNDNWLLPNTKVDVTFIDYTVIRIIDNFKMVINGNYDLRNESGGIPLLIGYGINTVIYRQNCNLDIAFNGSPAYQWHIHKMMVYSGTPGNLQLAVNGFGSQQGQNNLLMWGTDRDGRKFRIQIDESIVFNQSCDWLPCSGIEKYTYPQEQLNATITFGYNNNNDPISGSECPTRFRMDWNQHGQSGTIFLPL